jgi:hypothetical protein
VTTSSCAGKLGLTRSCVAASAATASQAITYLE